MEGRIIERLDRCFLSGWCVVVDKNGDVSMGFRGGVKLPQKIFGKVLGGEELGDVVDSVMGVKDTKRKMKAIGMLTRGLTDRREAWEKALIYAMARRLNPDLYR